MVGSVSSGGWTFPLHRVVDDRVGTRDGLTRGLQLHAKYQFCAIHTADNTEGKVTIVCRFCERPLFRPAPRPLRSIVF